jgi:hypothetical protein
MTTRLGAQSKAKKHSPQSSLGKCELMEILKIPTRAFPRNFLHLAGKADSCW